jgi:hypothetical protein
MGDSAMAINATDPLFLAGQVHALVTFAQVLATIYPDRDRLLVDFQAAEQVGLANMETRLAGENLVRGYQHAIGMIRRAIEAPANG